MMGVIAIGLETANTQIQGKGLDIHGVSLAYASPGTGESGLSDVDLVLILWQEDGNKTEVKRFWSKWPSGQKERKDVEVPKHPYQKVQLRGTATEQGKKVKIEAIRDSQ